MKRTAAALFSVLVTASVTLGAPAAQSAPRGYSIPLIDLAGEAHRQVIVDREPGQYLGHPTTVLLEDGRTMITVYPKGHGSGAIVMKRSTDGGLTWSERLPTPTSWATSRETPTIHRVIGPDGVRRLIVFSGLYPIRMAFSVDDGATWSELEPIGDFGGIVAMGSVERLVDGRYMAMFHDDGRFIAGGGETSGEFWVYKTLSDDGGLTWSEAVPVVSHPTAHLCEPGLIRSPDGKQIAVLLRENSRQHNSFVMFSNDEGQSWSTPRELPGSLTGDRHVGRYAPDGRLFISFRDTTHESSTRGDWVGWVGTYEDIAEGREGQYRVRLMDNHVRADTAYPGVEVLPDGTFVTTTYGHWVEGEEPFIASVRFTLDELDAKAAVGADAAPTTAQPNAGRQPTTLRILAYNIKHGEGNDGVVDLERSAELIRSLNPDLVALQEIDNRTERTGGVAQAARLGELTGMGSAFGKFMDYQGGEYGMAVLSRLDYVNPTNHMLPEGAEPRSSIAIRVQLPDGEEFIFAGIHFYRTDEERMAQARRLVDVLSREDVPVILAGDFNSTPDSEVMAFIAESFEIPGKGADHFTFRADRPNREIDFIVYRPADRFTVVESRVIDEPVISDHRPVLLVLEVRQ